MAQYPPNTRSSAVQQGPQYYDLSAPLTRPVTTLQVTNFTLREGMLPSLVVPDGSLYYGPVGEDGKYRIPSGCGIIFFRYDETVPSTFISPNAPADDASGGGLVSYFFSRGVPQSADAFRERDGQPERRPGQFAAAFTGLCKRYQQGDRYGGDWAQGVFHGEGVLVTSYFTYQGGWKDGIMHGRGTITYTRKYVDSRPPAAARGAGNSSGGVGTLLLKGLSYVTPFELVATAAAPKEYIGDFYAEHGRHGTGLMRYYNGDVYEGEWCDNCRHGKGKLRKQDGEIYEGEWVNDEREGYGKILFPNGSLFKGLMQHDQRSGEGVMRFANGDEYFGNFVADRIEGHGTMKYRNGDVYDGAWHDQLRHGMGKYTLKRSGATMRGPFQNGLIHGEGTVVIPGVSTFVGTFVRGERTTGTMHWHQAPPQQLLLPDMSAKDAEAAAEGSATPPPPPSTDAFVTGPTTPQPAHLASPPPPPPPAASTFPAAPSYKLARKNYLCYQGEWHGEHMHGRGLLWYTNGDFFSGRFQKSLRHGPGNMRYAAEQVEFSGQFVRGIRHGLGLLQRADGSIRAGRWQQNLFAEGYEGEWDGSCFHGIGRLTMPLDTFFGLRATNSTLKLTGVSAILNEASSPPPVIVAGEGGDDGAGDRGSPPSTAGAADAEPRNNNNTNTSRQAGGASPTGPAPLGGSGGAAVARDAMRRADLPPHFIDFFGVFRGGVRDGLGMLKLPALDCLVGGTLNLSEEKRGAAKAAGSQGSGAAANNNNNSSSSSGGNTTSAATPPPSDAAAVPSVVIKGRWVNEVLHCEKGVLAFPSGMVYIGGFRNGIRDGACARVWWPDGSVMESGWSGDAPSGLGVWYQRNRLDPVFQTIVPSVMRRSRSRRTAEGQPGPRSAEALEPADDSNRTSNTTTANNKGDLFGLSYLWGLVGLGFGGGGDAHNGDDDEAVDDDDSAAEKPRRVLVDFQSHFAMACAWYPYALDLSSYTRIALPQIAAQTAPLPGGTPWPLMLHSPSMYTALSSSSTAALAAASSGTASFSGKVGALPSVNTAMSFAAPSPPPQQPAPASATVKQLTAGAAALHLAEAPPKVAVGRANGPAVVYYESGVVLAAEWLSNVPRLAVPYRPWSAYDCFLAWQASRPAARNCMNAFPLWVAPRSQSCYSALLAAAPGDVRGEPKRPMQSDTPHPTATALSPLAAGSAGGSAGAPGGADAATRDGVAAVTSPDTRCTVCGKEYSFFRKRVHCTLCLRSTCSSCLGPMDTDGPQQQEDVKALLRHGYATAEQTVQLAAAAAKSSATSTNTSVSGTARRIVFPSLPIEQVERVFDGKSVSTVPICADCVRTMLWKLRYTQLWVPTSMFASVVDIERHQRDLLMQRKANTQTPVAPETDAETTAAEPAGVEYSRESSRQVSMMSEQLPTSQLRSAEAAGAVDSPHTPLRTNRHDEQQGESSGSHKKAEVSATAGDTDPLAPPDDSPVSTRTSLAATSSPSATAEPAPSPSATPARSNPPPPPRHARAVQDAPRPSGELLPPTQYITYSGYTSHSIPHIYGELWWGRRYYYRGSFCAGERHGFGVQYMPNGERYEGAFQRDAWHGNGVYYMDDGSVLLGEFRRGELRVAQYHGEVEEDTAFGVRPHGRGIGYDGDGSVYNGEWVHGRRHGTGMLHLPDGISVYSGTFVNHAMEGMGKLVTTSGAYYGDFSQNQQHGKGMLFTANCVVEGSWVYGASSGFTRIYESTSGEVYETTYRDGNERDDCFSAPIMVDDAEAGECGQCGTSFSFFLRRHHCRLCGDVFCDACSQHRATLPANFAGDGDTGAASEGASAAVHPNTVGQRVCDACFYRLTQRRMIALRRYKDGAIYAGCWSQGRWVAQGLYCRPDGIFVVMDAHGHPLLSADITRAKLSGALDRKATARAEGESDAAAAATASSSTTSASAAPATSPEKKATAVSRGVPPGGLGVPRRPARTMLPISSSILQDASPAKELLDNTAIVRESSSRKDLDAFLMWWATTRSRCGLQVPLDVLLVSKYQRMPAQLLRGGKNATVAIGSDAATYLTCPARCTLATPTTPSLAPIRLFVTLADSRRAMQAMVDGEVTRPTDSEGLPASQTNQAQQTDATAGGAAAAAAVSGPSGDSITSMINASFSSSAAATPSRPRLTVEERRTIDSDVEAAALRAARFMPVAIPRAPTVPVTAATVPTTTMSALDGASSAAPRHTLPRSRSSNNNSGSSAQLMEAAAAGGDGGGSAFGLTAWATRTPPRIDEEDITDEKLMAMMRAERLSWGTAAATTDSPTAAEGSRVEALMPPTPAPPAPGENNAVAWDLWTTREIPRYAPPPLSPVMADGGSAITQAAASASLTPGAGTMLPAPHSEADLYFGCPLWEPSVPDAQMLLEQGKMTQAAKLMRRLQRQHERMDAAAAAAAVGGGGDRSGSGDDSEGEWGTAFSSFGGAPAGGGANPGPASPTSAALKGKKRGGAGGGGGSFGSLDTLDVLQQRQAAASSGGGGAWTAGGLLSAEQRAQSGGGWAPAPMHGPFTFDISTTERRRSADGQRWLFKVDQREATLFQ